MNIVFSGFKNSGLETLLVKKGYKMSNVTNQDTLMVIAQDTDRPITTSSAKIKRAMQLNIPIVSKEIFIKILPDWDNNGILSQRTIKLD
tara:strand:- start:145 stop:411 length:267 start_codon:yes stop_codon:yes gene_type:complete